VAAPMSGPAITRVRPGQRSIPARAWNDMAGAVEGVARAGLQGLGGRPIAYGIECELVADVGANDDSDYLSCRIVETGEVFDVLKPPLLRPSVTERGDYTYSYADPQSRTSDDGASTEEQVIVEAYLAGDTIIARPHVTTGGLIVWMDTSARKWAKENT